MRRPELVLHVLGKLVFLQFSSMTSRSTRGLDWTWSCSRPTTACNMSDHRHNPSLSCWAAQGNGTLCCTWGRYALPALMLDAGVQVDAGTIPAVSGISSYGPTPDGLQHNFYVVAFVQAQQLCFFLVDIVNNSIVDVSNATTCWSGLTNVTSVNVLFVGLSQPSVTFVVTDTAGQIYSERIANVHLCAVFL